MLKIDSIILLNVYQSLVVNCIHITRIDQQNAIEGKKCICIVILAEITVSHCVISLHHDLPGICLMRVGSVFFCFSNSCLCSFHNFPCRFLLVDCSKCGFVIQTRQHSLGFLLQVISCLAHLVSKGDHIFECLDGTRGISLHQLCPFVISAYNSIPVLCQKADTNKSRDYQYPCELSHDHNIHFS